MVAYAGYSVCFNMARELAGSDIDNSTHYQAVEVGVTKHRCGDLTMGRLKIRCCVGLDQD